MKSTLIHRFDCVDSTLRVLADTYVDAEHLTTVIADHQTEGRGRTGRAWNELPGNSLLTATLLRVDDTTVTWVTVLAGLAMCHALRNLGFVTSLKWPNDVIYRHRKVAGILSEHLGIDRSLRHVIAVGAGVNLGVVPQEAGPHAIGLGITEDQRPAMREALLDGFLGRLDELLEYHSPHRWRELYMDALGHLGMTSTVHLADGSQITVTARGVDDSAALIGMTPQGRRIRVSVGDVDLPDSGPRNLRGEHAASSSSIEHPHRHLHETSRRITDEHTTR
ncbi:biotin--[acetyl-CoA-carboxylase] ligase [Schaalia sp. ZJ405]|uniref:biotin--[acetyl-CoA-carboxylase] ligase n=1 Tax=Schaalia sp. ZJ405 TaxID=2709403 RepID=UPI0013EB296A|nr:biotin--[acetyl-CoA-carboxylase] ligase [Schaalia sp. ZJ405]QPK81932.1 biotin--[acetyl-CoA-carboxylase] ligase [Schaalia sp. ZJ405]